MTKQNVICRDCGTLVDECGRTRSAIIPTNYFVECPECGAEGKYNVDTMNSMESGYSPIEIKENSEQFAVVTQKGAGMMREEMGLI